MKYIYATLILLCANIGYSYDSLVPPNNAQIIVNNITPVLTQTQVMVYHAPYFTVTVPVQVSVPVNVAQPVQQTFYWGYPYQPIQINYWQYNRCRLFNY